MDFLSKSPRYRNSSLVQVVVAIYSRLGIRISRKNAIRSIQFNVGNQNKQQIMQIRHRIWIFCHVRFRLWQRKVPSKLFPWFMIMFVTDLRILTRNLPIRSLSSRRSVMFLLDKCECYTFCYMCVKWIDNFRYRFATMSREIQHILFTIKDTHLNLSLATANKMAVHFFSVTAGDVNWATYCGDVWFLYIPGLVFMLKAIKCFMNTSDRHKYHFFVS